MPIDREKNAQIKVTIPRKLHGQFKRLSERTGIPIAQMLLHAAIEKYKEDLKEVEEP